jgi:hypothetical protein
VLVLPRDVAAERPEAAVPPVVQVRVRVEEVVDDDRSVGGDDAADVSRPDDGAGSRAPRVAQPDVPRAVLVREDGAVSRSSSPRRPR